MAGQKDSGLPNTPGSARSHPGRVRGIPGELLERGSRLSCQTRLRRLADPLAQVTSTNWLVLPKEPLPKLLGPERDCRSRPQTWQEASLQPGRRYTPFHASGVAGTGIWTVAKCWVGCWILLDRRAGRSPEGYPTCLRFQSESHAAWSSSGSKWGFLVNAFGSARLRKSSGCLGAQCVPKQTLDFETGRWDTEWDHSPWRTCFPPAATRPEALLRSQGCCLLSHCFRDSLIPTTFPATPP